MEKMIKSDLHWYCITLGSEQKDFGFDLIIRSEMEEIWIARGGPEEFSLWGQDDNKHGNYHLYLSPLAAELAQSLIYRFHGTPCSAPNQSETLFLLGTPEDNNTS